jgi:hypothetical protein
MFAKRRAATASGASRNSLGSTAEQNFFCILPNSPLAAQTRGAACDKIVVLFDIVNTASNGALDVTGCAATFTQPLQNESVHSAFAGSA